MSDGISFQAADVRRTMREGRIGKLDSVTGREVEGFALNSSPQAVQISTATVDTADDDTTYAVEVEGSEISIDSGAGATPTSIAAALAAAINGDAVAYGRVVAAAAVAVVTLTGRHPGVAFSVTSSDVNLTLATPTPAVTADPVPFGRAVVRLPDSTTGERRCAKASTAAFTAQVLDLTMGFVDTSVATVRVYQELGDRRELLADVQVLQATSAAQVAADTAAALEAALPANTVAAAVNGTDVRLTAELPGLEFSAELGTDDPALQPSQAPVTGPNAATSLHRAWLGISVYSGSEPAPDVGLEAEYGPNRGVRFITGEAKIWVEDTGGIGEGDDAYLELSPGEHAGKLYAANSATRLKLGRGLAYFLRPGRVSRDRIALLRLA